MYLKIPEILINTRLPGISLTERAGVVFARFSFFFDLYKFGKIYTN